jgi:regulation of enolase protein 1 (concanavalin A-like superfamily)
MVNNNDIDKNFFWFNEPVFEIKDNKLFIRTSPDTDFWQKTHYGFERDNGHCLLTKTRSDFSLVVRTEFSPEKQYDQCGLMVRLDSENWIKTSIEFETANHSRMGSVVTNSGYSDWATIDIHNQINEMWYRIQSNGNDFLIEYSYNGTLWNQLRITHLHKDFDEISIGIYACSPMDSSFQAVFDDFTIGKSNWK